jgi:hypothetical protein
VQSGHPILAYDLDSRFARKIRHFPAVYQRERTEIDLDIDLCTMRFTEWISICRSPPSRDVP